MSTNTQSPATECEQDSKTMEEIGPSHSCYICNKEFSSISSQRMHIRNVHHQDTADLSSIPQSCCPLCHDFRFSRSKVFHNHLEKVHAIMLVTTQLLFNTVEDFWSWKHEMETASNSSFIKARGEHVQKDGSKKIVFHCNRSGKYVPRGMGHYSLKSQGSRKLNATCPASIEAVIHSSESDKSVNVKFLETHCGHSLNELCHLDLTRDERETIAGQLKAGVNTEKIIETVRENAGNPMKRKHLLTKKDLRNIKKAFKISECYKSIDELSGVDTWVDEMRQLLEKNPVIFYKQANVESNVDGLDKDDFCLIVMTDGQKQILAQYGHDCVCLDSTHGNCTAFEMTILFVVCNNKETFPVALLFSNRQNVTVYKTFFDIIKLHVGIVKPHTLMSEDSELSHDAWTSVMGEVPNRLLCPWHVVRSWQRKLVLIKSMEKQRNVLKRLKSLQTETDETAFLQMLENLIQELKSDSSTATFGDHLITNYCNRVHLWASCYHKGLGINANPSLERIHRIFKFAYREGKKEGQMDKPIRAVLKFVQEKEYDGACKAKSGPKMLAIRNRHRVSEALDSIITCPENEVKGLWYVQSSTVVGEMYEVRVNDDCSCKIRCEVCDKCVHNFSCTCPDYIFEENMCKHIHEVCLFQRRNNTAMSEICLATDNPSAHLGLQIIQGTENSAVDLNFPMAVETTEIQAVPEKCKKLDTIRAGFEKVVQMCYTNEHIKILEEAVNAVEQRFLVMSLVNHNQLQEYIHNC